METILRASKYQKVTIPESEAESGIVDARHFAGGLIYVPEGWDAADLSFRVVERALDARMPADLEMFPAAATTKKLRDETGGLVRITNIQTAEAGWYAIPAEAMMAGYFTLYSTDTVTEAAENQTAERSLIVQLKA